MEERVRVISHSDRRFGRGRQYETPMQELNEQYERGKELWWHWTYGSHGLKEDPYPQSVLLVWDKKVFGRATATISRKIDRQAKVQRYNFAFILTNYERLSHEVPLSSITKRKTQQGGTFSLHPREIERCHELGI